jgi:hypothetical protein
MNFETIPPSVVSLPLQVLVSRQELFSDPVHGLMSGLKFHARRLQKDEVARPCRQLLEQLLIFGAAVLALSSKTPLIWISALECWTENSPQVSCGQTLLAKKNLKALNSQLQSQAKNQDPALLVDSSALVDS